MLLQPAADHIVERDHTEEPKPDPARSDFATLPSRLSSARATSGSNRSATPIKGQGCRRLRPAWIPDPKERHERPQLRIAPPPVVALPGQLEQCAQVSSVLGLRCRSAHTPISICAAWAAFPAFSRPRGRFGSQFTGLVSVATVVATPMEFLVLNGSLANTWKAKTAS